MKIFLFLFYFSLSLLATTPKVYMQLGDSIYMNSDNIVSLIELDAYKNQKEKIEKYAKEVAKAKVFGFGVQDGSRSNVKLDYLAELRRLSKINEYFLRDVRKKFLNSMKVGDSQLFIALVNSGLVDIKAYKKQIMTYYENNKEVINPDGIIQEWLDEAYAIKHKKRWKPKTKEQLAKEKVQRLRENDKRKQEALEKKLAEELKVKKELIRKTQEEELFN